MRLLYASCVVCKFTDFAIPGLQFIRSSLDVAMPIRATSRCFRIRRLSVRAESWLCQAQWCRCGRWPLTAWMQTGKWYTTEVYHKEKSGLGGCPSFAGLSCRSVEGSGAWFFQLLNFQCVVMPALSLAWSCQPRFALLLERLVEGVRRQVQFVKMTITLGLAVVRQCGGVPALVLLPFLKDHSTLRP